MGLVAPWHVGSSWTRARTHVPCIGRRILNHCATREVPCRFLSFWSQLAFSRREKQKVVLPGPYQCSFLPGALTHRTLNSFFGVGSPSVPRPCHLGKPLCSKKKDLPSGILILTISL